jgi:glycosyltransferase involved in cell wall biosynthesis
MRQLLIVAYYFPPLGGIGSKRVTGFATYLSTYGWEVTVLSPRDGAYYRDPDIAFPEERVVRTASIELSRTGKRLLRADGDDVRAANVGGLRGVMRSAARAALYFPDAQVGWFPPGVIAGRRMLREARFDAIFSSSFPITSHLIARNLHRTARIPWVAEFRDPWSQTLPLGSGIRRRATKLERAIARQTAGLVMTSPSWADVHSRAWDRRVTVIPNGHDGSSTATARETGGKFTLAYLGSFYPATQRLGAVWRAIKRTHEVAGPSVDRLRFIGDLHPAVRRELHDLRLESLVEETGFLPHVEAMAALRTSSALLLAGPHDARGILRGHVAAKLSEYLATDLPIVYVGDPECDAADLLRRYPGCQIVSTDDVEGVVQALKISRGRRWRRDVDPLSRRALTGRLAMLLDEVCDR